MKLSLYRRRFLYGGFRGLSSTLLEGLIAWFDLDETTGARVDATGNGYNLTEYNSVGYGNGKIDNGALFDSTASEHLESAATWTPGSSGYTMGAWVKPSSTISANQGIITRKNNKFRVLRNNPGKEAYCDIYDNDILGYRNVTGPALPDDEWSFVVGWFDPSDDLPHLRVNETVYDGLVTVGTPDLTAKEILVGSQTGFGNYYDGLIDLPFVFDKVLTTAELDELFNLGGSIKYQFTDKGEGFRYGLNSYWRLGEASGDRIDSHGSDDLTSINAVGQGTGISGSCAQFLPALDQRLQVTHSISGDEFTFSCWINSDDTTEVERFVFGVNEPNGPLIYLKRRSNSTDTYCKVIVNDGAEQLSDTGVQTIATGWLHLAVTVKLSTFVRIYFNGTEYSDNNNIPSGWGSGGGTLLKLGDFTP